MKDLLLFVIAICVGLAMLAGYSTFIGKRIPIQIPIFQSVFRNSSFSLEKAPTSSLVGKITSMSGEVDWQSRTATESAKISSPISIQQGENLTTKEKSKASVLFDNALEIDISEKSEIGFAQTLPADLVLAQGAGVIDYKKLGSIPVSIRALHTLIENSGDITLTIDAKKPILNITVNSGSAVVAFNDINNISNVLEVKKGQTLIFNDDTRLTVVR